MMKKLTGLILASTILLSGCAGAPDPTGTTAAPTQPTVPWKAEKVGSFEPETGKTIGTEATATYVTGFDQDGDSCELEISVPADGFYDLEFVLRTDGGFKQNYVFIDGQKVADVDADGKAFKGYFTRRVYMSAGTHQLSLVKYWGYVDWEKLNVWTSEPFDESIYNVSAKLVNPNASENAKRLFSYLCDNYGKHILTGQQCDTGMMGWEMRVIEQNTGKYPAVMGLDMMDYQKFKGRTIVRAIFFLPVILNSDAIMAAVNSAAAMMGEGINSTSSEMASNSAGMGISYYISLFGDLMIPDEILEYVVGAVGRITDIISASGVQIVIFIAALQAVPSSLYEVAKMEGATAYETFWKVTFPMVMPHIITNIVYTVVDSFISSEVVNLAYTTAFTNFNYGLSSVFSLVSTVVTCSILAIVVGLIQRKAFYYT